MPEERPKDENEQIFLTLDVGTEYIKTILYLVEGGKAHVIGFDKLKQSPEAMEGAMIVDIESVAKSSKTSISAALEMADKILEFECPMPKYATFGISGELVKGASITAEYEREDPKAKITEEELEEIVEMVKDESFESSIDEIAGNIGLEPETIQEISSHINSVHIDGKYVKNALGFAGYRVVYNVFSTFAPTVHVSSILDLADKLDFELLAVEVQPYAIAKTVEKSENRHSGIYIDIGGGTTDVAVVQDGTVFGTEMFAFGGRVFTKRLQKDMNLTYENAEKIKLNFSNGDISGDVGKKIQKALNKDINYWLICLEKALSTFEKVDFFPTQIFLSGGGSKLPLIRDGIISYPWLTKLKFARFPKVEFLGPDNISKVEDANDILEGADSVAAAALTSISLEQID